jgi:uncharacterized membrane protein YfcA
MQASTPLAPQIARKIALRQGLLFGTFAGCFAFLSTAFTRFLSVSTFSLNFIYVLAFIAFFVAGRRTAKKTNRMDMGALAGFWAGVAVAILGLVTFPVLVFVEDQNMARIALSSIVYSALSGITPALLALLFGTAIGALGGFIGKIYVENSVSQPTASPQPAAPVQSPLPTVQPVQPTQPSAAQQDQA